MVATIEAKISLYPVSQKPPGVIDCLSAKELIRLLFSPHGRDNEGLIRAAWTSPTSTCGCKTDSITKPRGATDKQVPMDECDDNLVSTDSNPETLPPVETSAEVPKAVSPSHHSQATTDKEEVLASPPTASLAIDSSDKALLLRHLIPGAGAKCNLLVIGKS